MNKEKIAEEIIAEVEFSLDGLLKYCFYCECPSCIGGYFICPDRNKWKQKLKATIEKILKSYLPA